MADSKVIKTLAKVMVATAWVDGSVSNEELNNLKDLLFQLPDMTASDWAEIDIYLDSPVEQAERERLVSELQGELKTSQDKEMAISAIKAMVNADGRTTYEEKEIEKDIESAISEVKTGMFGRIGRSILNNHSKDISDSPNRELFMDDFEKNKIYYSICRKLELSKTTINMSDQELRRLSLAGGLMARVAYLDTEISDGEFNSIVQLIQEYWGLEKDQATLFTETAISEISKSIDYYYLSRSFFEATTEEERVRFLDVLFAIAAGDGFVSYNEIEEIRTIANVQKLTHKQFIDAKLKIPRDKRAD